MGYMRHHAIVITSQEQHLLEHAHLMSKSLGLPVSSMISAINGYISFCVLPDGSKEGWAESNKMNECRDALIEWLAAHPRFDWAELSFGDEEGLPKILRNSSEGRGTEVEIAPIGGGG